MLIALLQMTSGIDPAVNAADLRHGIAAAKANGAGMVFAPEMAGLLDRDRARAAASIHAEGDDPVLATVREAAAKAGLWVQLGSLAIRRDDGRLANRSFVIDDTGTIRARNNACQCAAPVGRVNAAGIDSTVAPACASVAYRPANRRS